jgi:hypothetical protein
MRRRAGRAQASGGELLGAWGNAAVRGCGTGACKTARLGHLVPACMLWSSCPTRPGTTAPQRQYWRWSEGDATGAVDGWRALTRGTLLSFNLFFFVPWNCMILYNCVDVGSSLSRALLLPWRLSKTKRQRGRRRGTR